MLRSATDPPSGQRVCTRQVLRTSPMKVLCLPRCSACELAHGRVSKRMGVQMCDSCHVVASPRPANKQRANMLCVSDSDNDDNDHSSSPPSGQGDQTYGP